MIEPFLCLCAHDDADKIEAQIKAARDAGASGFLIWNARNVYERANYLAPAIEIFSER